MIVEAMKRVSSGRSAEGRRRGSGHRRAFRSHRHGLRGSGGLPAIYGLWASIVAPRRLRAISPARAAWSSAWIRPPPP